MNFLQDFRSRVLIIFLILLLLAGVGSFTADWVFMRDPRIFPHVHVAQVDVGGLTKEEARKKLSDSTKTLPPVVITDKKDVWLVPAQDLAVAIDLDQCIDSAYGIGRNPDIIQRWQERWSLRDQETFLPVMVKLDKEKLAGTLAPLETSLNRQARSASIQIISQSSDIAIQPAIEGRRLNTPRTVSEALNTPQPQMAMIIELKFDTEKPPLSDIQLSGINSVLASFSTHFKPWDSDRTANLRLATERIHGKRLNPGEIFSYNDTVGSRTQQQGFYMAPVIVNGKLVPDWGGGVCQVSSTLYNAVLLANLDIVERSNHGLAIGYVPLGFDATVVDGQLDFKFKNSLQHAILIFSRVTNDELFFYILGDAKDAPPPIELDYVVHKVYEPMEIKQQDPTLEAGKEVIEDSPQRGFRVSSYRIRTIAGKQERQLLATDDYDPVNRIIKVGTKNIDNTKTPPPATAKTPDKPPGQNATGSRGLPPLPPPAQTVTQNPTRR